MASTSDTPAALVPMRPVNAKLQEIVNADPQGAGWDNAWQQAVTPWDSGDVQPPLRDLVVSRGEAIRLPRSGRALVPGCGRVEYLNNSFYHTGYDAVFIASTLGLDVVGVDISLTCIKAANGYAAASPYASSVNITFRVLDFFMLAVPEKERFDLIYDHTFFVAIPPSLRTDWGRQINALMKPGGILITLMFPLDPETDTGPPFYLRPEHYDEALGEGWQKVLNEVPARSSETHVGRERLVVWKKRE